MRCAIFAINDQLERTQPGLAHPFITCNRELLLHALKGLPVEHFQTAAYLLFGSYVLLVSHGNCGYDHFMELVPPGVVDNCGFIHSDSAGAR
jgi:hypothetical protein